MNTQERPLYRELQSGQVYFDSRRVTKGGIFFALKGEKRDGQDFTEDALMRGAAVCFVRKTPETLALAEKYPNSKLIFTNNPLHNLQILAKERRKLFKNPLVAVTGSNGKTIVKEWLFQILCKKYYTLKSPKSYNSQIGVPVSTWHLRPEFDLAIFEAGISKPGEMQILESLLRPDLGILTNLGTAHDADFASKEHKLAEKLMLFKFTKKLIVRENIYFTYKKRFEVLNNTKIITWGESDECQYVLHFYAKSKQDFSAGEPIRLIKSFNFEGTDTKTEDLYCLLMKKTDMSYVNFKLPFYDAASIENAFSALILCVEEGWLKFSEVEKAISCLKTVEMRLQCREGVNNTLIVDDAYNNDFAGLEIALDFMILHASGRKKTVIITEPEQFYEEKSNSAAMTEELLLAKKIDKAFIISNKESFVFSKISCEKFISAEDFKHYFEKNKTAFRDEIILVKGAREYTLEQLTEFFLLPHHGATLEVNLNAIAHNLHFFRSLLAPHTALMCMVKASAYGSSYEIAHLLAYHGVDYLGVAYTEEGVFLRESGIVLPIMVMNTFPENFAQITEYNLQPSIFSTEVLRQLGAFLKERNAKISVHLEFDTGMKRLGFEQKDMPELVKLIQEYRENIDVSACFTHPAASDDEAFDAFTHHQIREFIGFTDTVEKILERRVKKHVLNTAGILRFRAYHFDMVRLGIGLYGIEHALDDYGKLRHAATLKASVSQIREVKKGESIGYGRNFIAQKDILVGTISIGYADGYSRCFGNGVGNVFYKNRLCPVVGNVCMDMCMVDLTGTEPVEGDKVIIFGEIPSVSDLACSAGTIEYEILSQIGSRVKRVFFEE